MYVFVSFCFPIYHPVALNQCLLIVHALYMSLLLWVVQAGYFVQLTTQISRWCYTVCVTVN